MLLTVCAEGSKVCDVRSVIADDSGYVWKGYFMLWLLVADGCPCAMLPIDFMIHSTPKTSTIYMSLGVLTPKRLRAWRPPNSCTLFSHVYI